MRNVRWIVNPTDDERAQLDELVTGGTLGARKMKRALTLQLADKSWLDVDIADAVHCGISTVYRTRAGTCSASTTLSGQSNCPPS